MATSRMRVQHPDAAGGKAGTADARGVFTLDGSRSRFLHLFLSFLIILSVVIMVAFWNEVWAFWFRPWHAAGG